MKQTFFQTVKYSEKRGESDIGKNGRPLGDGRPWNFWHNYDNYNSQSEAIAR